MLSYLRLTVMKSCHIVIRLPLCNKMVHHYLINFRAILYYNKTIVTSYDNFFQHFAIRSVILENETLSTNRAKNMVTNMVYVIELKAVRNLKKISNRFAG